MGRTDLPTECQPMMTLVCHTCGMNEQGTEKSRPRQEFTGRERMVGHEPKEVNGESRAPETMVRIMAFILRAMGNR